MPEVDKAALTIGNTRRASRLHAAAGTVFLNVDLDIYSSSDLQRLVAALGKKVVVLHVGREGRTYSAHLELAAVTGNPNSTIRRFCALIRALPHAESRLWKSAKIRDFNVGVQAEMQPFAYELALSAAVVQMAAKVGARIVFTVYAPEKARKRGRKRRVQT